ncbi:MAG: hypothetical protein L0H26_00145 [Microlunatus sp.]|nr:hypothetical protein [Microlunatus sp.]
MLPQQYPAQVPLGFCLHLLGLFAEERGQDAAGLAVSDGSGTWTIGRTLGPFRRLARDQRHIRRVMSRAVIALGHTRWATQGGHGLAQASPLEAGPLLCTHNGDIDPATIPGVAVLPASDAATDSHYLFGAIAAVHARRPVRAERLVSILSGVRGRAALAWTDTTRADRRVWLARGGLSPLAVGVDQHGGLWWASNPAWLRVMADQEHAGLQMVVTLLPEGSLWAVTPHRRHVSCRLIAEFKPTVRPRDEAIAAIAVWRGFNREDTAHDQTLLRHRTVA